MFRRLKRNSYTNRNSRTLEMGDYDSKQKQNAGEMAQQLTLLAV